MPKVEILRNTIDYIESLEELLNNGRCMTSSLLAATSGHVTGPATSSATSGVVNDVNRLTVDVISNNTGSNYTVSPQIQPRHFLFRWLHSSVSITVHCANTIEIVGIKLICAGNDVTAHYPIMAFIISIEAP